MFAAACVGVVLDKYKRAQRHFTLHTDTISALALHPDSTTVATGQLGEVPVIYVWDSGSLKALRALQVQSQSNRIARFIGCFCFASTRRQRRRPPRRIHSLAVHAVNGPAD